MPRPLIPAALGSVGRSALAVASLALAAGIGGSAATAQNYRDLAPRSEPAGPTPSLPAPPSPKASDDQRQILAALKGLVFVDGLERVQRNGIDDQRIDVTTLMRLNDAGFMAAMAAYLGKPLTFAKLGEITNAVIARYRDSDHPLVDVVVPQQDVNNGVVQIAVVEFRVGQIRPEGNKWFSDALLRGEVRLQPGDRVVASDLADDIAVLNDNPFRRVDLVYERSREVGRTDLVLRTEDRLPIRGYLGFDDTGTRALGINHFLVGFNWGNVFGLDHQLGLQTTASDDLLWGNPSLPGRPDKPRFLAHSGVYTAPLPWHDRIIVYGLYAESVPRLAGTFNQIGISDQASLRYAHPILRSDTQSHEVRLGYDFKQSNNNLEFGGVQVSHGEADIHQFVLEYTGQLRDLLGSTSGNAALFYSPGGFARANSDGAFQTSGAGRAGARANYVYGQIGAERLTLLPFEMSWSLRGLAQFSSAPLLASEQFGLGGPTTVRGYDEYFVEGDEGWLVVNELRSPTWRLTSATDGWADRLQLLTFVDVGHVRSLVPQPNQPSHATLSSVGLGLRYGIDRYLDLRADYGWQLTRLAVNPGAPSRGHISLVLSY